MQKDISRIHSVQLEVSSDSQNYHIYREISRAELNGMICPDSTIDFFSVLLEAGRSVCLEKKYEAFRLKVSLDKGAFFVTDSPTQQSTTQLQKKYIVPEREKARYSLLTKREKEVLCFLYRGYQQDAIAYVFGMSVHTIKKHRYNIYEKAGFRNRTELALWCEKYLLGVFQLKPSSEMTE